MMMNNTMQTVTVTRKMLKMQQQGQKQRLKSEFDLDDDDDDDGDGDDDIDGGNGGDGNNVVRRTISSTLSKRRSTAAEMPIFKMSEHSKITTKLSLPHLRRLCLAYGLKKTGTKPILIERARSHCFKQCAATILQRVARGYRSRMYVRQFMNNSTYWRSTVAVNETDVYTMDDFTDIPHYQLFRFNDKSDNMVYQFNMASFFKLLKTAIAAKDWTRVVMLRTIRVCSDAHLHLDTLPNLLNPYNRAPITNDVVRTFFTKMAYSRMMRHTVCVEFKEESLTPVQLVEGRILELFQDINALGNYADSNWMSALKHPQHIRFLQELYDIWTYRAELSMQTKCQICPPNGCLFANLNSVYANPNSAAIMSEIRTAPFNVVREINLSVIDRLVRFGVTEDDRKLGAFYVLSALTLVSLGARDAMPWLYQSVVVSPPVQQQPQYNNYYYYAYADPVSPPINHNIINNNIIENGGGLIQMDINNLLQIAMMGSVLNQNNNGNNPNQS